MAGSSPWSVLLLATLCSIAARTQCRVGGGGVMAVDLSIDADMVQNIQSANKTAGRFSSTDYVDLTCKVDYSILDGPGAHLTNGIFLGDTVARETFVTQFVQDVSAAANISHSRVFVLEIAPGRVHHDWEANNVIILFRLIDNVVAGTSGEAGAVTAMGMLTTQAQESDSVLYRGMVTNRVDSTWGIVAVSLDVSLRLTMAIEVIGGDEVHDGYYLSQGAQGWCERGRLSSDSTITESRYCEWEDWFTSDVSNALALQDPTRVSVLFVKRVAADAVLVHFRIREPSDYAVEATVDAAVAELLSQLRDANSSLFAGNVTVAVDPSWGLSGDGSVRREYSPHLPYQVFDDHRGDQYERCKDVHRCNRAWIHYDSNLRSVNYTTQAFRSGLHIPASLFADFEDWRMGTFGWTLRGAPDPRSGDYSQGNDVYEASSLPRGGHFDPRNFTSLGPRVSVEARGSRDFSGLILDEQQKDRELAKLRREASDLDDKLSWTIETRETARLDATRRSRSDTASAADEIANAIRSDLNGVLDTVNALNSTQCLAWKDCSSVNGSRDSYDWWDDVNGSLALDLRTRNTSCPCTIIFNTSSLNLEGAISATGDLAFTAEGTEVAVWSFDQVYLGPEIVVKVTGQRALAILSRGSLILNTSIVAEPSTLGGFPGGGGIAREPDLLLLDPAVPPAFPLGSLANGSLEDFVPSYNVNGPGSASYRYYLFTISTSADDVDEIQRICTTADEGQSLGGCFHLSYRDLSTECVPHNATSLTLQDLIEDGLNTEPVDGPGPLSFPRAGADGWSWFPGVGRVNVTAGGSVDDSGGRCWDISFSSAVGAIGPLNVSTPKASPTIVSKSSSTVASLMSSTSDGNRLLGNGANISVETLQAGNAISGDFSLKFHGQETERLAATNVSGEVITAALLKLEGVLFARTSRTNPTASCSDSSCNAHATSGGGMEWTVELGTRVGNAEPRWPAAAVNPSWGDHGEEVDEEGGFNWPEAVDYLEGTGAAVEVNVGWARSAHQLSASFNVSQPFTIALGGAGASHGGIGGRGPDVSPASGAPRTPYSSPMIPDLVGGSGGSRSGLSPATVNALGASETTLARSVRGLGGAGGGAIEVAALNDVTIGAMGAINVNGGDGTEDWDSGGGGGSGGSVVIAAGGTVRLADGASIDARGGDGGRTLRPLSRNGGGGGAGGRVAVYAQTVTIGDSGGGDLRDVDVDVGGGRCFVTTKTGVLSDDACGEGRTGENGTLHVNGSDGYTFGIDNNSGMGGAGAEGTNSSLILSRFDGAVVTSSGQPFQAFRSYDGPEYVLGDEGGSSTSTPRRVSFYFKIASTTDNDNRSRNNSNSSSASENSRDSYGSQHASASEWGAVFALIGPGGRRNESFSSPGSFNLSSGSLPPSFYNSSSPSSSPGGTWNTSMAEFPAPNTTLVSVAVSGGVMRHGVDYRSVPGDSGEEASSSGGSGGVLDGRVERNRWYKVDIMIRWDGNGTSGEYDILVDGIARAESQKFGSHGTGDEMREGGIERVGLYVLGEGRAWFDEIYLGPDFTMGFKCPQSSRRGVKLRNRGSLQRWEGLVDPGQSSDKLMQRHENFLSKREKYLFNNGGLVPFDGNGMREYTVDEYVRDGSDPPLMGGLRAGSLLQIPRSKGSVGKRALHEGSAKGLHGDGMWSSDISGGSPPGGRRYWYGEHEIADDYNSWANELATADDWTGGVGACSTSDLSLVDWKFEGIMLHYANVTDMVLGREPEGGMILQQPKTLRLETRTNSTNGTSTASWSSSSWSSSSSSSSSSSIGLSGGENVNDFVAVDTYVMWMGAGEQNMTFGLSAVATSSHPDGPFKMRRTLYPDGNETHDQTVFVGSDGRGYLARTYYAEIEYVIPGAVMQPVWSSVEKSHGSVDFGLSYHRAFYSKDYDDYHDIYLQRWRMEDLPWRVTCVNRISGISRDVPYGDFNSDGGYCNQPKEYKVILGQGYPVVSSRFKDPELSNNSFWSPDSVPAVNAQSWAANYRDGLCGIREMDEGFDLDDPTLDTRSAGDRSTCSNIADNPIHDTLPDKLVGTQEVVETRLAKYVAVSLLTRDLLDTSAVLSSFEGELEGQEDLMALVSGRGHDLFDWSSGTEIGSTFHHQVYSDYEMSADSLKRYHQYEASENDRAFYTVACQVDGTCPVNFKDQLTEGHA